MHTMVLNSLYKEGTGTSTFGLLIHETPHPSIIVSCCFIILSGLCSTWGNGAFRTFDNGFYHFTSTCNYILSRHCKGGTEDFNIQIRRGPDGNLEHVFIQIEGVKVLIVNGTITVQDAL